MKDDTPDYSRYSIDDLHDVARRVNKQLLRFGSNLARNLPLDFVHYNPEVLPLNVKTSLNVKIYKQPAVLH